MSSSQYRKPYRSKSVPYMNLKNATDPNARKLWEAMNKHPARTHIYLGPLWTTIYNIHKKGSTNLPTARKTATIVVLDILNKIGYSLDPVGFIPVTLEVYVS